MNVAQRFYTRLTKLALTEGQQRLYSNEGRGFNSKNLDEFLPVFLLAVHYARWEGAVVIAVPKSLEKRIIRLMAEWTRQICRRYRGREVEVKAYTDCVKRLRVVSRLLTPEEEPQKWVAIGFSKEDPIPQWMRKRLV